MDETKRTDPCIVCKKLPCDSEAACLKQWLEARYPGEEVGIIEVVACQGIDEGQT